MYRTIFRTTSGLRSARLRSLQRCCRRSTSGTACPGTRLEDSAGRAKGSRERSLLQESRHKNLFLEVKGECMSVYSVHLTVLRRKSAHESSRVPCAYGLPCPSRSRYGLQGLGDSAEARSLVAALTPKVLRSQQPLLAQHVGNALSRRTALPEHRKHAQEPSA